MTTLDTTVDGDVGAVRTSADGVGALSDGLDRAGSGFGSAASGSESQWTGSAADAFRGKITSARQATRVAATASQRLRTAMHTFADRMDQVKARMRQAESVASAAGLTVSGNSIEQPTPPARPAAACYAPGAAAQVAHQYQAAVRKYQRQRAAYQQAERIIQQARQEESDAHTTLTGVVGETRDILAEVKDSTAWQVTGVTLDTMERGLGQAAQWEAKAQRYEERASTILDEMRSLPPESADYAADAEAYVRTLAGSAEADAAAEANRDIAGGLETGSRDALGHVGLGMSAASFGIDALDPHDRAQHLAGDATETAVNAGATELIENLSLDSAPETYGLSLVAGGLAIGAGYGVEHYGPAAVHWAEGVPGTIADGGQTVVHGAESLPGKALGFASGVLGDL
jgi:uncharacterized protein YukE